MSVRRDVATREQSAGGVPPQVMTSVSGLVKFTVSCAIVLTF
jgi:hypothetical protein